MEVRTELITELREKFFKKLADEGPPDPSVYIYFHIVKRCTFSFQWYFEKT